MWNFNPSSFLKRFPHSMQIMFFTSECFFMWILNLALVAQYLLHSLHTTSERSVTGLIFRFPLTGVISSWGCACLKCLHRLSFLVNVLSQRVHSNSFGSCIRSEDVSAFLTSLPCPSSATCDLRPGKGYLYSALAMELIIILTIVNIFLPLHWRFPLGVTVLDELSIQGFRIRIVAISSSTKRTFWYFLIDRGFKALFFIITLFLF